MHKKTTKIDEFDNFSKIANEWWIPNGKFKILHKILPIRIDYIIKNVGKKNLKDLKILDLGCGGGLTCEPLARLGAKMTGIDFIKQNIEIAKKHAVLSNLEIEYLYLDIDLININKKYDVILILEVLEHLDNWPLLIKKIRKYLKPKGKIIFSTINKTQLAKIFAINIAERFLKWVPKDTHNFDKFIKPDELKNELIKNGFKFQNLEGMNFNILTREWNLNSSIYPINYFCTAQKI